MDFELDTSRTQLSINPVQWFKAVCDKVKKTFYTLWDAVEWVVEQKTDEKKPSPFPNIEHRIRTEKYHENYFHTPKNITPKVKRDMRKQRRDKNEKPIIYYF
ncbi:MAG: hypothetical protein Q4D38_05775 [Planctomycetia bacterium]|nr:hypothetical protein [Planctomycetia bacterium]